MSIVQRMRAALKDSMKARDAARTSVLRYWIAQLTLASGEEMPDLDAVKKTKSGQTTWSPEEVALIQEWVPASLGRDQIDQALGPVVDQIKAAPKEGMAIGLAMKALGGQPVDSDDVRAAVASIRG